MQTLEGATATATAATSTHTSAHRCGRRHLQVAQWATVAVLTVTAVASAIQGDARPLLAPAGRDNQALSTPCEVSSLLREEKK